MNEYEMLNNKIANMEKNFLVILKDINDRLNEIENTIYEFEKWRNLK